MYASTIPFLSLCLYLYLGYARPPREIKMLWKYHCNNMKNLQFRLRRLDSLHLHHISIALLYNIRHHMKTRYCYPSTAFKKQAMNMKNNRFGHLLYYTESSQEVTQKWIDIILPCHPGISFRLTRPHNHLPYRKATVFEYIFRCCM